jgi:type IV secretion system protein VirD4
VLSLFFQQAIGLQTRELPERNPALRYQVMMLLDEFTALGRIPIIAEAISYLPGYNVRVVLVIQTPAQLREVYGLHNSEVMLKSLAARIVFAPKDYPDAREISDELGFTTVKVRSVSKPASFAFEGRARRSRSLSISEQRRALLLPQEVKELGAEEAIVFYEGLRPIRCRKIRYFSDPRFRRRLLPAPASAVPAGHARPFTTRPAIDRVADPSGPGTPACGSVEGKAEVNTTASAPAKEDIVIREATPADALRRETLELSDFATDFSKVSFPDHDGPPSGEEMDVAVGKFVDSLEQARET